MRFAKMMAGRSRPQAASMRVVVATDCLASAGQRRRADLGLAGNAPRASLASPSNSSRRRAFRPFGCRPIPGLRLALPNRAADRTNASKQAQTGRHPYRHRRADRLRRTSLLPQPRPAVHDELYDAISRIHFGPRADPARLDLCGAATVSRRRNRDHGGDAVADDRAWRARIRQPGHVDARGRH